MLLWFSLKGGGTRPLAQLLEGFFISKTTIVGVSCKLQFTLLLCGDPQVKNGMEKARSELATSYLAYLDSSPRLLSPGC